MGRGFIRAMADTNLVRREDGRWHWKHDYAGPVEAAPGRWERWQAVTCQTLLVRGGRSPALSDDAARRMVAGRPNATLVVVPEATHFVALDQPEAFERAVRAWLAL